MFLVGITGGIGAGKSTVSAMLAEKGAVIIAADAIAREVVEPGQATLDKLCSEFGPTILNADQTLNRQALASIAFSNEVNVQRLNDIVHPPIMLKTQEYFNAQPADSIVVYENPLLVEQGVDTYPYDLVVVVDAPLEDRIHRLINKRGMTAQQAHSRLASQAPDDVRNEAAEVLIINDGVMEQLAHVVEQLWAVIEEQFTLQHHG